jgi:hypothetical protein
MAAAPSIKDSQSAIRLRGRSLVIALTLAIAVCGFGAVNSHAAAAPTTEQAGPLKVVWPVHNRTVKTFEGGLEEIHAQLINPNTTTIKGTVALYRTNKKGGQVGKSIADGDFVIGNGSDQTLILLLTDSGSKILKKKKSIKVRAKLLFTDNGGLQPSFQIKRFTLVRKLSAKQAANTLPVANGENFSIAEGGTVKQDQPGLLANDSDADGDQLSVVPLEPPKHFKTYAVGVDGSFNYVAAANYSGTDSFTYLVTDGVGDSSIATVTFTIATKKPTIATIPNQSFVDGAAVNFATKGFVTSSKTVTYGATGLPGGLSINTTTGVISGTATPYQVAPYVVTLSATNSAGTTTKNFNITTTAVIPAFTSTIPAQTYDQGQTITAITPTFTGSAPTFGATNLPDGLSINTTTGVISGTIEPDATPGTVTVTVTATNAAGSANTTFSFTVDEVV